MRKRAGRRAGAAADPLAESLPQSLDGRAFAIVVSEATVNSGIEDLSLIDPLLDCINRLQKSHICSAYKTISGGGFMNSLIKAVAIAVVLSAPIASFSQSNQPVAPAQQNTQAAGQRVSEQKDAAQADTSGYGSGSNGTWQAGRSDTTLSSYSPPIYNAR